MLQKWTAELPISDNLEWCYNGKFYENLDGFSFFYSDSKCLIGLQFSKDGQLLYHVFSCSLLQIQFSLMYPLWNVCGKAKQAWSSGACLMP